MEKLIKAGRIFYGVALAAVGFQLIFYADFHPMIFPPLHAWLPVVALWAYLAGVALLIAGAAIVLEKKAREVSLILGAVLFAIFLFYYIPYEIIVDPYYKHLGVWGNAQKEMALAGGAFLIAGSFSAESSSKNKFFKLLEKLIPFGAIFFCITMISFGIDHLLYTEGISMMVPTWIPYPIFWTYFAAVALMGSGAAIILKIQRKIIATLLGVMIFLWLIVLHIPGAIAHPFTNMGNEPTSALSALAFSGIAFVIAGLDSKNKTS